MSGPAASLVFIRNQYFGSGVYFHEYEPLRFLRPVHYTIIDATNPEGFINFEDPYYYINNVSKASGLLRWTPIYFLAEDNNKNIGGAGLLNISSLVTKSMYLSQWYYYDQYITQITALSGSNNVGSGMLNWLRGKNPIIWKHYDDGASGNRVVQTVKSFAFPYDDFGVITGVMPTYVGPLQHVFDNDGVGASQGYYSRIAQSDYINMPWYTATNIVRQAQNHLSQIFTNPQSNYSHPSIWRPYVNFNGLAVLSGIFNGFFPSWIFGRLATNMKQIEVIAGVPAATNVSYKHTFISGVAIPNLDVNTSLILNNLNIKPTGWINENNVQSFMSGVIIAGSGRRPFLSMAQQINYPYEYTRNHNAVFTISSFSSTGTYNFNPVTCNAPSVDMWSSELYFGHISPKPFTISLSGTIPSIGFYGNVKDLFDNNKRISYTAYPHVYFSLIAYRENQKTFDNSYYITQLGGINNIVPPSAIKFNDGYTLVISGIIPSYTYGPNPTAPDGSNPLIKNASVGSQKLKWNTFNRYYDPTYSDFVSDGTYTNLGENYVLLNQLYWELECLDDFCPAVNTIQFTIPSLTIPNDRIFLKIDGRHIPINQCSGAKVITWTPSLTSPAPVETKASTYYDSSIAPTGFPYQTCWIVNSGLLTFIAQNNSYRASGLLSSPDPFDFLNQSLKFIELGINGTNKYGTLFTTSKLLQSKMNGSGLINNWVVNSNTMAVPITPLFSNFDYWQQMTIQIFGSQTILQLSGPNVPLNMPSASGKSVDINNIILHLYVSRVGEQRNYAGIPPTGESLISSSLHLADFYQGSNAQSSGYLGTPSSTTGSWW